MTRLSLRVLYFLKTTYSAKRSVTDEEMVAGIERSKREASLNGAGFQMSDVHKAEYAQDSYLQRFVAPLIKKWMCAKKIVALLWI